MKKNLNLTVSVLLASVVASSAIIAYEGKRENSTKSVQSSLQASDYMSANFNEVAADSATILSKAAEGFTAQKEISQLLLAETAALTTEAKLEDVAIPTTVTVAVKPKTKTIASRGAAPKTTAAASTSSKATAADEGSKFSGKKTELLDWWKAGSSAFPIGAVVTVKDVYTGRTFKIKRTMGSNHADCEALTLADANTIKSIWGGFSWDVRPIHILINGRVLAASMSSLPHAGVDSAPAFATVSNRSEGYGTGQNLDTIKGNGMNGHFDVHFLNSTRHKDGQEDSYHQAAIKVAASR